MRVKLNVDWKSYTSKPSSKLEITTASGYELSEQAMISIRLAKTSTELNVEELAEHISNGRSFCVGTFEDKRRKANFISSQIIGLDFDAGMPDSWHEPPHILYQSFSHTAENPKYRAVWFLDSVVTDADAYKSLVLGMFKLYPEADKACSDCTRLFFGTNKDCHYIDHEPLAVSSIPCVGVRKEKPFKIKSSDNAQEQLNELMKQN